MTRLDAFVWGVIVGALGGVSLSFLVIVPALT